MRRRDIAALLLDRGAPLDLFAAMLGELAIVARHSRCGRRWPAFPDRTGFRWCRMRKRVVRQRCRCWTMSPRCWRDSMGKE